jgi:Protein of unknown function (DUF2589)
MASATDSGIDLSDLLSAPLVSTTEADMLTVRKFMEFLHEFGFTRHDSPGPEPARASGSPTTDFGRLRMLSFDYMQPQPNGSTLPMRLRVPALTMVPLPLLQVTEADFDFALRIVSAARQGEPFSKTGPRPPPDEPPSKKLLADPNRYRFKAMLARGNPQAPGDSRKTPGPSLELNLKVHVKMRHADMPTGVSSMIQILTEAIHREVRTDKRPPEGTPPPKPGSPQAPSRPPESSGPPEPQATRPRRPRRKRNR